MTSLIRLRQLIEGERNWAIAFLAIGSVSILFSVVSSVLTQSFTTAGVAGVGTTLVITGIVRLTAARRDLAAFETEHGVGAGKQQSIT